MLLRSLFFLLPILVGVSFGQNLQLVTTPTKLPNIALVHAPAVYDGDDSIYILGGFDIIWRSTDIFRYTISTDTIVRVGATDGVQFGSAVWAGPDTGILYFGGYTPDPRSEVYNYRSFELNPGWNPVAQLPTQSYYSSSVSGGDGTAYIFGGWGSQGRLATVSRYANGGVQVVAQLPTARYLTSSVFDPVGRNAFIFGGNSGSGTGAFTDILKFDSLAGSVTKLGVNLSVPVESSCALLVGEEAYVGVGSFSGPDSPAFLRFNVNTNQVANVTVANFPPQFSGFGCAYVQKNNRIYVFGGSDANGYKKDISYIAL